VFITAIRWLLRLVAACCGLLRLIAAMAITASAAQMPNPSLDRFLSAAVINNGPAIDSFGDPRARCISLGMAGFKFHDSEVNFHSDNVSTRVTWPEECFIGARDTRLGRKMKRGR
jgi:hypothetical protein